MYWVVYSPANRDHHCLCASQSVHQPTICNNYSYSNGSFIKLQLVDRTNPLVLYGERTLSFFSFRLRDQLNSIEKYLALCSRFLCYNLANSLLNHTPKTHLELSLATMAARIYSLAALATATLAFTIPPWGQIAPLHVPAAAPHDLINNSYIVMFKEDVKPSAFAAHMSFLNHVNAVHPLVTDDDNEGSAVGFVYNSFVAKGYAGKLSQDALEMIRHRPEVDYVEQEQYMYGDAIQQNSPWVRRIITIPSTKLWHLPGTLLGSGSYLTPPKAWIKALELYLQRECWKRRYSLRCRFRCLC